MEFECRRIGSGPLYRCCGGGKARRCRYMVLVRDFPANCGPMSLPRCLGSYADVVEQRAVFSSTTRKRDAPSTIESKAFRMWYMLVAGFVHSKLRSRANSSIFQIKQTRQSPASWLFFSNKLNTTYRKPLAKVVCLRRRRLRNLQCPR